MYALPATVPEGEPPRSDVVAARLARKVAVLFGVAWGGNPFRRTWVCDFTAVTLAELARGAPQPTRERQARLDGDGAPPPAAGWGRAGRAVWSPQRAPLPGGLAAATLNQFGPDTKAAAVLTGANRLLREVTAAVAGVVDDLAASGVEPQLRLAAWAGLVLEAFRGQPALVTAAVQARHVQRALTSQWRTMVVPTALAETAARCELGAVTGTVAHGPETAGPELERLLQRLRSGGVEPQPVSFDLVDATLPLLRLEETRAGLDAEQLGDVADAWCRRLLRLGRPGRGVVWVEEGDGHRRAHAYLRVGAIVAPFIAAMMPVETSRPPSRMPVLPPVPSVAVPSVAAAPVGEDEPLPVRARLIAAHAVVNYLRYRDEVLREWPQLRASTRDYVAASARWGRDLLPPEDPALTLLDHYGHYLRLWDLLQAGEPPADRPVDAGTGTAEAGTGTADAAVAEAVSELLTAGERLTEAYAEGRVDPGTTTYLLEIGNVALARASAPPGRPAELASALDRRWRDCLAARGLPAGQRLADQVALLPPAHVFHLLHYGAHLADTGDATAQRGALTLVEAVIAVRERVAAAEPARYPAKHTAARHARDLAARIAARLDAAPDDVSPNDVSPNATADRLP